MPHQVEGSGELGHPHPMEPKHGKTSIVFKTNIVMIWCQYGHDQQAVNRVGKRNTDTKAPRNQYAKAPGHRGTVALISPCDSMVPY